MEMVQVAEIVNASTRQFVGEGTVLLNDLSNVVDVGTEIFNATSFDHYVKSLVDHIGRVVFVNRVYTGNVPSMLMDGWEYGAVMEKIQVEPFTAEDNDTWNLVNGSEYPQDIFYKPTVSAKFYNKRVTFDIPCSITERQVKSAFSNATQLNAFISSIMTAVENGITIRLNTLILDTIDNMIAKVVQHNYAEAALNTKSTVQAVNLLYLFNKNRPEADHLTAENCITNMEFLKFASYTMGKYVDRLGVMSTLFNVGGKQRHTPKDKLHFVLLSDFAKAANSYLQADTFHEEYTRLPNAETVAFWQGSGTDFEFADTSKIIVKPSTNAAQMALNQDVTVTGILGVMWDRDAMGVSNLQQRVTSHYNAKAEFTNNWFKCEAGYFNDLNENCVVFFVA